jgi:hypothetical protein
MGLRVTPENFSTKAYNTLKPYAKVLTKHVCGDNAKKNVKGKSNACNNAAVAVETQEDGPLDEEREHMMLQLPMMEDALPVSDRVNTASC